MSDMPLRAIGSSDGIGRHDFIGIPGLVSVGNCYHNPALDSLTARALESDGVALDPLEVALTFDARSGETWHRVAEASTVQVWAIGSPIRGFVLAVDHAGARRCAYRFDACGVELAKIEGPRVERTGADRVLGNEYAVDRLVELVERVTRAAQRSEEA
jgi:hypothetical protein